MKVETPTINHIASFVSATLRPCYRHAVLLSNSELNVLCVLSQSTALRVSLHMSSNKTSLAQVALSRRFLILAVIMPLSFLMMYTVLGTYQTFQDDNIVRGVVDFVYCRLTDERLGKACVSSDSVRGLTVVIIMQQIYNSVFSSLIVVYSSIPAPARAVWIKNLQQVRRVLRFIVPYNSLHQASAPSSSGTEVHSTV